MADNTIAIKLALQGLPQVEAGLGKLGAALQGFKSFIGPGIIAGITAELGHFVTSAIDTADAAGKMAQKVGIATEQLTALEYSAKLAGVSNETLQRSLAHLSQEMVKTGRGGEDVLAVLLSISDEFQAAHGGAEKTSIAIDHFGRKGIEMIPLLNAGSAAIKEQAEEARKLGIVIGDDFARNAEKFNDNLTKLKLGAKGVVNEIVADMLPTLSNLSAIFAKAGIESRSFISKGIETLAIGQFGAAFKGLELAAAKVASLLGLANQNRSAGTGDLQTFATREQTLHSMLAANDAILRSVQANTLTSPSDRREASIGVLRDELKQLIELEKIATDNLPGPITTGNAEGLQVKTQERIDAEKKLYDVQRQRIDVTAKLIELDRETFSGKMLENLQALAKDWGNLGVQMADGFKNTFMSAVDTISDGITGLITGTLTWAQALRQIGTNILTEIVHSIVQVGVRWIATQFLMAATGQAVLASTLAITAPIAAAQSAIWAVPATLSTIASYGASAEAAPAFVLQSLAESLGALAGFSGGGFTGLGNTSQPAGVVHGGEFVFSAPATSRLGVDNLESLHQAALSPSVNVQGHSVINVMVRDQSELRDFLKSRAGRDEVVNIVRTYRTEIGIA